MIRSINLNEGDYLTYTDFIAATLERSFFYNDERLREAINKFDVDNKEKIEIKNIKEGCKRHGHKHENDKIKEMIKKITPLGRMGEAIDVANLIEFLCSEKSSFITGTSIIADGGQGKSI